MVTNKRRDRRPAAIVAALVAAQIVIGSITVRDIRGRSPDLVRGPRLFWILWGGTNTLGSALYWLLGRRRGSRTSPLRRPAGRRRPRPG